MDTVKLITISVVLLVFLIIVAGGTGYFAYSYNIMTSRAVAAEANYKIAKDAQQASEKAVSDLKQDYENMQVDLLEWKERADRATKNLSASQKRIKKLEAESEETRAILNTVISCDLWLQLWPNSRRADCNQNRETTESQSAIAAN